MKITVSDLYLAADAVYQGSSQELDVGQAERVADFFDKFAKLIEEVEPVRQKMLKDGMGKEEWDNFLLEEKELPDFNFKEFPLRWKPDSLRILKRVGLFS